MVQVNGVFLQIMGLWGKRMFNFCQLNMKSDMGMKKDILKDKPFKKKTKKN